MPDFEALYPGRFLKKHTLEAAKVIRILKLKGELLEGDDGAESKAILQYRAADGEGEIVWCKTNAILTAAALGGERDHEKWSGRLLTIYMEPSVKVGGEVVGGVRVLGSPELKRIEEVKIKFRKKAPEVYVLVPTDKQGNPLAPGGKLDRARNPAVQPKTAPATPAPEQPPAAELEQRQPGEEG
jgi:hypothetical protein